MKILNIEQLLQIHSIVIGETGGSAGLRDLGRLESAIALQTQHVFDQELYVNEYEKAAAIVRAIIADHPFVDGNKRTAMLTGLTFLNINNIKMSFKDGEIENFAVKIATNHLDIPEISNWLKVHCK